MASFTCPKCGRTSHNPHDAEHGYCGACHDWTGDRQWRSLVELVAENDAAEVDELPRDKTWIDARREDC